MTIIITVITKLESSGQLCGCGQRDDKFLLSQYGMQHRALAIQMDSNINLLNCAAFCTVNQPFQQL